MAAADLGVLAAVKRAYDAGLSTAEIQARLHDGALPPVARARVARLKELGSPWARAGAVADFVARYYRYDEDFLDDLVAGPPRTAAASS